MAFYLRQSDNLEYSQAYLYKWTHIPTKKWYVGCRTAKGCHINDGYICSSYEVKPLILQDTNSWKREILVVGESKYILELEHAYLTYIDAKNNIMSFNRHNGDGNFTTLGRKEPNHIKQKRISKLKGMKKPNGFGEKVSKIHKNKTVSDATKKLIGLSSKGRIQNRNARLKNSLKNSGDNNAGFKGYYINAENIIFDSSYKAGLAHNVSRQTIVSWAKNNKNGWKFIPKGSQYE